MTLDPELQQLLGTIDKIAAHHVVRGKAQDLGAFLVALDASGVVALGEDTIDLPESRLWLREVVEAVATHSPSVAFSLAARYTADRAAVAAGATAEVPGPRTAGRVGGVFSEGVRAVVAPFCFEPSWILVLDDKDLAVSWVRVEDQTTEQPRRTGLAQADLRTLAVPLDQLAVAVTDTSPLVDWCVLVSGVGVGITDGALRDAEAYAHQREQFGAPIATFSGLRAVLVSMFERCAAARAIGIAAAGSGEPATAWAALDIAARAAVDVGLDAIQVHGGYGYIDEYPVASRVRDAVSLRARTPHRAATAGAARARLDAGPPDRST